MAHINICLGPIQETLLWDVYRKAWKKGTAPVREELPAVVHFKGGNRPKKVRYLQELGLWAGARITWEGTPPTGRLVPVTITGLEDMDELGADLAKRCVQAQAQGEVLVFPNVSCDMRTDVVFPWPGLRELRCYPVDAYTKIGGKHKHDLEESCRGHAVAEFELPYVQQREAPASSNEPAGIGSSAASLNTHEAPASVGGEAMKAAATSDGEGDDGEGAAPAPSIETANESADSVLHASSPDSGLESAAAETAAEVQGRPAEEAQGAPLQGRPAEEAQGAPLQGRPAEEAQGAPVQGRPAEEAQGAPVQGRPAEEAQGAPVQEFPPPGTQGSAVEGASKQGAQGGSAPETRNVASRLGAPAWAASLEAGRKKTSSDLAQVPGGSPAVLPGPVEPGAPPAQLALSSPAADVGSVPLASGAKIGVVIGRCSQPLEWLAAAQFSCDRYEFVIYDKCAAASEAPANVRACTTFRTISNKGQDISTFYSHIVDAYDSDALHSVTVYVPGEPDCGAHSSCDASKPLEECACLSTFLQSLQLVDVERTAFMPLNRHLVTVRSTSWPQICAPLDNLTGLPNRTADCNSGEISWINAMRDTFAVSKRQIRAKPKALYESIRAMLDVQGGHGSRWWSSVEERTNGLVFGCSPIGWLWNESSANQACVDWGPEWCACVHSKLKHSLPAPPCSCDHVSPRMAGMHLQAVPDTDCSNYQCAYST
ncbi:hypothetical protein CYMTET_28620 [Cymbomonas tetramitiformis]|uniref:Uncharacterized protein n=1 Tax=Cymbomonas tetramitiformis TaxID=36881 RepID=A0AAE0KVQ6_9CHLO|nr:hypothetical protein CYMTET_28620 [Cymbomonas tetramitiformis]